MTEAGRGGGTAEVQERIEEQTGIWRATVLDGKIVIDPGSGVALIRRLVIFLILIFVVYLVIQRLSVLAFAPDLEVDHVVVPDGFAEAGTPVALGVVFRNNGRTRGTGFVVASLRDGSAIEGPTLDVPPRDTAFVPVRIPLDPGEHVLSLVAFDGWRGMRRLATYTGLVVQVGGAGDVEITAVRTPSAAFRGGTTSISVTLRNVGPVSERVVPDIVLRPEGAGLPHSIQGNETILEPGQRKTLEVSLDTWPLLPGSYLVEVFARSGLEERVGRYRSATPFVVAER